MNQIIVIDGWCASGKSTLASRITKKMKYLKMSTGELHRINAYLIKKEKLQVEKEKELSEYLKKLIIRNYIIDNQIHFSINGVTIEDVAHEVTEKELIYATRNQKICNFFSDYCLKNIKYNVPIVVEGHGIGNGTFKSAYVKFFLDASLEVRAMRRCEQEKREYEKVYKEIQLRDNSDKNRVVNPVKISEDMTVINVENISIDECEKFAVVSSNL